jgi:hypothetical protein
MATFCKYLMRFDFCLRAQAGADLVLPALRVADCTNGS